MNIAEPISLEGKTCLVSGATNGLGRTAAFELARLGATVVLVSRRSQRLEETRQAIYQATGNAHLHSLQADLSSMAEVRRLADLFCQLSPQLDILINNVGVTLLRYQASPEGYETTWALNYLGHFLLTHLLLDPLEEAARQNGEARVIEVSSNMYRLSRPRFEQRRGSAGYNGVYAYAQSKRAMLVFVHKMARCLQDSGVTINAVTPGAVRTHIATDSVRWAALAMRLVNLFALPVEQGVQPILRLALAPELSGLSGGFYVKNRRAALDRHCTDPAVARQLWQISSEMSGLPLN